MEWISVRKRLPKTRDEYIVAGDGDKTKIVSTLEYRPDKKKWWSDVFDQFVDSNKITHWMPLPEPLDNK